MKRFVTVFFSLLVCTVNMVFAIPKPTPEFYCNDFANVLSEKTRREIIDTGEQMRRDNGVQIVVTTVNNMEGKDIETYSLEMAREYQIGQKGDDNGILILFAKEERKLRIEVGYGMEGILPDSKAGRLMDQYAIPHLRNNDFDTGLRQLYLAVVDVAKNADTEGVDEGTREEGILIPLLIVGLIVILSVVFTGRGGGTGHSGRNGSPPIFWSGRGGFGRRSGGGFSGGGSFGGGGGFGGGGSSRGF